MKNRNIAVVGTIGVGKSTLIERLSDRIKRETELVRVQPEPSVTIPFVNDVLKKFYDDNSAWSFPLQLCVSAAQESYMQELRESQYDYALFDAPYSSDIYGYSHSKHRRMRLEDFYALVDIGRPFRFDYLIWIHEDKETTIKRIKSRNRKIEEGDFNPDRQDVSIDDFSYLDLHIEDFEEYMPIYINKFKSFNKNIKIIELRNIPDLGSEEYDILIENIFKQISE